MSNDNPIYWQDEILQMMFWMRGEGLGEVVSMKKIMQFLNADEGVLAENIQRLVDKGYLGYASTQEDGAQRVLLTSSGMEEGKRRFMDEFESYLGHESHMVCDDPNCDCHEPEFEGVCAHLLEARKRSHPGGHDA
ncbi:MAG: hypothetical protein ACE5IY_18500 [bacterium]